MSAAPLCPACSEILPCDCPEPATPDGRALRNAFGRFATGVTVVTAISASGEPVGITVNSFSSVSLDPPLVLWSLGQAAGDFDTFWRADFYCINVLSADQVEISNRFACRDDDRFAGLVWRPGLGGVPVLDGCCASFEVRNTLQHEGGDHYIFVGQVERFSADGVREPLIFCDGRYQRLACD
ncbi:MAG: flavin reductase family protein [Betaproteobacteria bacterium]